MECFFVEGFVCCTNSRKFIGIYNYNGTYCTSPFIGIYVCLFVCNPG